MTTKTAVKAAKPRMAKLGEAVRYVRGGRLLPALVTEVHDAECANLVAFDHQEARTHYPASVPRGRIAEPQDGDYWFYPDEVET